MKQFSLTGEWTEKAAQGITFVMAMGRWGIASKKWLMLLCLNLRWVLQDQAVIPARALQHSLSDKCHVKNWDQPLGLQRLCSVAFVLLLPTAGWKLSWLDLTTEINTNLPQMIMTYRKHLTAEFCGRLLLTFT